MFGPMLVMSLMSLFPRILLSSNPQARWRGWPEGQLDPAPPKGSAVLDSLQHLQTLSSISTIFTISTGSAGQSRPSPTHRWLTVYFFDNIYKLYRQYLPYFLYSLFVLFGANFAPTWPPSWSQNPPNIAPRAIPNPSKISSCFWCPLGLIFGGFLVQLGVQNHSKIHPKLSPEASQQANDENSKM